MATVPNYFLDAGAALPANPFQSSMIDGLRFGATMQDFQAAQVKQQQEQQDRELKLQAQQRAQEQQAELQTLLSNPTPASTQELLRLSASLPKDQSASVMAVYDKLTTQQQQSKLKQAGQIYASMKTGNLDVTINLLQNQADAFRNNGNEAEAKAAETYIQMLGINLASAQNTIGLMMAVLPGGKEALENIDKTLLTGREEALQPFVLTKAQADANKAKVDAKFAEQITMADLEKKAADLGLTKAQTGSVLAQTKKLGMETAKAALELELLKSTGGVDPAKTFEREEKIRKEYQGRTKVYDELGTTFNNIKSSAKAMTGPGDIALITGFMKMLDPSSVVRETEFATARDTAGLFQRLSNQATKLQSGQIFALDSKQRQEYVNLAKQYLDSTQKKAGEDKTALGVIVKNYKLNPENVFGPETETPAPAPPNGGRGVVNPPVAGQRNVTVDY